MNDGHISPVSKSGRSLNAAELSSIYNDSETVDQSRFATMRSNVMLVAGEHYQKKTSDFWSRIRNDKNLRSDNKLRLTKNHIANVVDIYSQNILTHAPNTKIFPNNKSEIQDQKAAELNDSVWEYIKKGHKVRAKIREFAEDYVSIGEAHVKIFWNPDIGEVVAYENKLDEMGQPMIDEAGQPVPDESLPVMSGDIVIEKIIGFNLLRCPSVQNLEDSPYIIIRKMIGKKDLKNMVGEEKYEKICGEDEETYLVFDGDTSSYTKAKSQIMVREHYYRPCKDFPNGYYYIATRSDIVAEGELPFGIWPIISCGFNKVQTSPRYRSPIERMRPYQIEINRSASSIATTQVTLGDDKILLAHGSKISHGGTLSGVRAISVTGGGNPTVMPGRNGMQFFEYMNKQIDELYEVMNAREHSSIREGKLDPYAMLFHGVKNREKFQKFGETFEDFVVSFTEVIMNTVKHYYDENMIVPMVGRSEIANISEFKNMESYHYQIRVEPVSDTADTMLGKQLAISQALQYIGGSLEKEDIGRMLRAMPFINEDEAFSDFTIDYDIVKNDMLAMERGEVPIINSYDDHTFLLKRVSKRMREPDFKYLDQQIQQVYQEYMMQHEQAQAVELIKIQRAQQGFIPTDGYLVTCDFYVTTKDGKTKRAKLPYKAIDWLIQQLESQGQGLEKLESMSQGLVAEMSDVMVNQGQASPQLPPPTGQVSPELLGV